MMNKYVYTDKQLNELNQGPNVYSVNTEFAQRKENRTNIVTAKSDNELKKRRNQHHNHLRWVKNSVSLRLSLTEEQVLMVWR